MDFPDRVTKSFKWLTGLALSVPVTMLLIGFGSPRWVFGPVASVILSIMPLGIVVTAFVAMLRKGQRGIFAFSLGIVLMHYFAMRMQPYTETTSEMLLTRGMPVIGVIFVLYFLREDLRYNLRPFWYSMQAMKELQESMMKMRAKREAKKRGETYDESKVMDAQAVVRQVEAQTGREVPKGMSGIAVKPGFRQESKKSSNKSKQAKRRKRK